MFAAQKGFCFLYDLDRDCLWRLIWDDDDDDDICVHSRGQTNTGCYWQKHSQGSVSALDCRKVQCS